MRKRYALCCLLLFGGSWTLGSGCGSESGSPAQGSAGDGIGGANDQAGAGTDAGQSSGGLLASGGAPHSDAGAGSEAGTAGEAGGPGAGIGGASTDDRGQLLFDSPGAGAVARGELFLTGIGLVWLYELDGKSFIANGPATGDERIDLVESEPISVFNVRSIIAYQAGPKLFAHPLAAIASAPVELEEAPTCVALSSAAGHVYCRSSEGTIVRWAETGGTGTVLATGVPSGHDLVADAAPVNPLNRKLYFCEDQGVISSIPLTGFGGTAIAPPQYLQINKQETSPRGLRVGVPGDDVLYWINVPEAAPARVRGSAKTTPPVTNAGPLLESTRVFAPYSWNAGAVIAIERADESAQIAFVRFGQSFITPHYESVDGVTALAAEAGHFYWLDRSARVFTGAPN